MKPTTISHVRMDKNLSIQDFENFLKPRDPKESKDFFAGKTHLGVFLLHRLPKDADSKLARLAYFLGHGAERAAVRHEIKSFLKDKHIEITSDIRKALPSRFSSGNSAALLKAMHRASADVDFVVSSFGDELKKLDWLDPKNTKTLQRGNNISTTAPGRLLGGDFSAAAKDIAGKVKAEMEVVLLLDGDTDRALVAGYQTLMEGVSTLTFSDQFTKSAKGMAAEVNRVMSQKLRHETDDGNRQAITDFGAACRKNIIPSLILRTLTPAIFNAFVDENKPGQRPDGSPTLGSRGVRLQLLTEHLKNQFNPEPDAPGSGKDMRSREQFPMFHQFIDSGQISLKSTMTALQALEQEIQKMST